MQIYNIKFKNLKVNGFSYVSFNADFKKYSKKNSATYSFDKHRKSNRLCRNYDKCTKYPDSPAKEQNFTVLFLFLIL